LATDVGLLSQWAGELSKMRLPRSVAVPQGDVSNLPQHIELKQQEARQLLVALLNQIKTDLQAIVAADLVRKRAAFKFVSDMKKDRQVPEIELIEDYNGFIPEYQCEQALQSGGDKKQLFSGSYLAGWLRYLEGLQNVISQIPPEHEQTWTAQLKELQRQNALNGMVIGWLEINSSKRMAQIRLVKTELSSREKSSSKP
jgi:hypothetical protein